MHFNGGGKCTLAVVMLPDQVESGLRAQTLM